MLKNWNLGLVLLVVFFFLPLAVMKEREMEIGYPTDVKHVAHIGWDGHSGSAPSWMNEFSSAPDFLTSLGSIGDPGDSNSAARSTWSSQDFELLMEQQSTSEMFKDNPPPSDLPNIPKKQKRKKSKSTLSPKSSSSLRSSSRAAKSKSSFGEMGKQANFLHFR